VRLLSIVAATTLAGTGCLAAAGAAAGTPSASASALLLRRDIAHATGYTTISFPGAVATEPFDVSYDGEIVGSYRTKSGVTNGFTERNGKYTKLDDRSASSTSKWLGTVAGVNNAGTVVGYFLTSANVFEGFVDTAGKFRTIADPHAGKSVFEGTLPEEINDSGTIVGSFESGKDVDHGFIWKAGKFTQIDDSKAGTSAGQGTWVDGIANDGTITGAYIDEKGVSHGFLRRSGSSFTVVDFPHAANTTLTCVSKNDRLIVGIFWPKGSILSSTVSGFELVGGKFTVISDPKAGKGSTYPDCVNDDGIVVGTYYPHGKITSPPSGFEYTPAPKSAR
jgi:hypothetical protein